MEAYKFNPAAVPQFDINNVLGALPEMVVLNGQEHYFGWGMTWPHGAVANFSIPVQCFNRTGNGALNFENAQAIEGLPCSLRKTARYGPTDPSIKLLGPTQLVTDANGLNIAIAITGNVGAWGYLTIVIGGDEYCTNYEIY